MGILSLLPPELKILLTWLLVFIVGCAIILIIAIGLGILAGKFAENILGWF